MAATALARPRSRLIELPCTSDRRQRKHAHLKLLSKVKFEADGSLGWEGKILAPGSAIAADLLPVPAVVIECVGPETPGHGHRRSPWLWILWRYDTEKSCWRELGRASAIGWEWSIDLRRQAYQALHGEPKFFEVLRAGRDVAGEVMAFIDSRLAEEAEDSVRMSALCSVYDEVAGRIANLKRAS